MPDERQVLWVLCVDYGAEGLKEPTCAFLEFADGVRVKNLMKADGLQTYRLIEVPVWPHGVPTS